MTTATLAIVNAPTLQDGLLQFLRLGDGLTSAEDICGVTVWHEEDGRIVDVEADPELPAGVLEYVLRCAVDPWDGKGNILARRSIDHDREAAAARRELLALLANLNPGRDLLATAEDVRYL